MDEDRVEDRDENRGETGTRTRPTEIRVVSRAGTRPEKRTGTGQPS